MPRVHSIEISPTGYASLDAIGDKRALRGIAGVIDGLARSPETQGKPLLDPFEGIRSVRAMRSRYRILYRVDVRRRVVSILLVGERRPGREDDVYAVARRLLDALRGGQA